MPTFSASRGHAPHQINLDKGLTWPLGSLLPIPQDGLRAGSKHRSRAHRDLTVRLSARIRQFSDGLAVSIECLVLRPVTAPRMRPDPACSSVRSLCSNLPGAASVFRMKCSRGVFVVSEAVRMTNIHNRR
jgi:hypothetical protein